MKILCLLALVISSLALTVEINNIHNGYRNIYVGTATIEGSVLTLGSYVRNQ